LEISRLKTNISQKGKVVALFVVITFAVAGLTGVTFLSESFVVAQGPGNDPITKHCFTTIGGIYDIPVVGTDGIQNWNKSIQNFVSLIPTDKILTLLNEKILGGSGPITDMAGFWNAMTNDNMTRHDRLVSVNELNGLLAAAQPGFTKIQQAALSGCIFHEVNSLGPTSHF
jgi:hypothetical protein